MPRQGWCLGSLAPPDEERAGARRGGWALLGSEPAGDRGARVSALGSAACQVGPAHPVAWPVHSSQTEKLTQFTPPGAALLLRWEYWELENVLGGAEKPGCRVEAC